MPILGLLFELAYSNQNNKSNRLRRKANDGGLPGGTHGAAEEVPAEEVPEELPKSWSGGPWKIQIQGQGEQQITTPAYNKM